MHQETSNEAGPEMNADSSRSTRPAHTNDSKEDGRPTGRPSDQQTYHPHDRQHSPAISAGGSATSEPRYKSWLSPRRDQHVCALQNENRELRQEVMLLRQSLAEKDKEMRQVVLGKAEKESELLEMKTTLRMYDECPAAEILTTLNSINSRIKSLAQNTAQRWMRGGSKAPGSERSLSDSEVEGGRRVIGTQLVDALTSSSTEPNSSVSILLPLAWQASIVAVVAKILSSFAAGLPTSPEGVTVDAFLQVLSGAIKAEEAQPAYGRWRFITHRYLKRCMRKKEEETIQTYVKEALAHCHVVGRLAMQRQFPEDKVFWDAFQVQIREIMEEAFKLRTTVQERTLTANYDPYLPANGTPFRAESMDIDEDDQVFDNDIVVCTVWLGMTSSHKNGRDASSRIQTGLFEKAVVLTKCNLEDILAGK
ncbi:hypothetical protein FRC00_000352 [Tulasnella sp. 408]|nr:hypothetical protein FRC00_000352 [Tulasnella sp. 408]